MTPTTIGTNRVVLMSIRSIRRKSAAEDSESTQIQPWQRPGFGVNGSIPLGIDRFPESLRYSLPVGRRGTRGSKATTGVPSRKRSEFGVTRSTETGSYRLRQQGRWAECWDLSRALAPLTLRTLFWPQASGAQNTIAAAVAEGMVSVLIYRLNSLCSRSITFGVRGSSIGPAADRLK